MDKAEVKGQGELGGVNGTCTGEYIGDFLHNLLVRLMSKTYRKALDFFCTGKRVGERS